MSATAMPVARASLAPIICGPDEAARYTLWEQCTGRRPRDDLSRIFAVAWGAFNENFCLDWTAQTEGWDIIERQRQVKHPTLELTATLDGYVKSIDTVIENKVLNPYTRAETVGLERGFREYYGPQVAVQMASRPAAHGMLNVQQGNFAPQLFVVNADAVYIEQVIERMVAFAWCVASDTPPSPGPAPLVLPELLQSIDLSAERLPNWAGPMKGVLDRWQSTRPVWAEHEQSKKDCKLLLPDSVGRVKHGAITISRARNGAISIREGT